MGNGRLNTGRARLRRFVVLALGCAVVASVAVSPAVAGARARSPRATGTVTAVADPDQYVCDQPGWVGFENLPNGTPLGAAGVPGVSFTAGGGGPWSVGDYASGTYDGKFPAGAYTSEELHWAWPGPDNGNGRITLDTAATTFSALVSNTAPVYLDAYDKHNTLIATAGPTEAHSNGVRHMSQMKIVSPKRNIKYVVARDTTGDPFTVDSLCTDATNVPTAQITVSSADGHPNSQTKLSGRGFRPGEKINVSLDGTFLGQKTANGSGAFDREFVRIAKTASPGEHTIVATGVGSGFVGTADYFVHTDWNQYGFDPQRTGDNPYENSLGVSNVADLHVSWSGTTGGRATAPAVAEGVVYMGSVDGAVYAFNALHDTQLWSYPTGGSIGAAPAIADGLVFTGSGDHNVYALDAGTGGLVGKPYPTGKSINKSPLVLNGVVYIGSDDGYMYALNESYTGGLTFKWRTHIGSKLRSTPATDGKNLYFGADDHTVHALNLATGAPVWQSEDTGFVIRSNPAVVGDHVIVGSDDGNVYSFSTTDGSQAWKHSLGEQVRSSPTIADGLVYIGSNQGAMTALSLATGEQQWQLPVGGPVNEKAAVANGVVYFGVGNGSFVAANAATGSSLLTQPIGTGTVAGVAVSDGAVYTVADTSEVKFDLS